MLDDVISKEEIKRYNEKINRYKNKGYKELPKQLDFKEIENLNPVDKLRLRDDIQDFLKRDSLRIDETTGEYRYNVRKYYRHFMELEKIKKELADNFDISTEKGTMGTISQLHLLPKTNRFEKMTHAQRMKSMWGIDRQLQSGREEMYKANYLEALETQFGSRSIDYKLIKNIVENMDAKELYYLYGENPDLQIKFIYSEDGYDEIRAIEILRAFYETNHKAKDDKGNEIDLDFSYFEDELRKKYGNMFE